jgi:hypothetical protein
MLSNRQSYTTLTTCRSTTRGKQKKTNAHNYPRRLRLGRFGGGGWSVVGDEVSVCAFRFNVAEAMCGVVFAAVEVGVEVGVEEDGADDDGTGC